MRFESMTESVKEKRKKEKNKASALARALAKDILACKTPNAVLYLFEKHGDKFSEVAIVAAMHRCAQLAPTTPLMNRPGLPGVTDPRLELMTELVTLKLAGVKPGLLADAAWAVAKIGNIAAARELLEAVAYEALATGDPADPKLIERFSADEISTTVWAFATAGIEVSRLFKDASVLVIDRIEEFDAQALVNTIWAYSQAKHDSPALFRAVALAVPRKMAQVKLPKHSAPWQTHDGSKFDKRGDAIKSGAIHVDSYRPPPRSDDFTPEDLALTAWAFARAGVDAPELFHALMYDALAKIADFSGQNLANMAWAYSTAGFEAPQLLEAVADEALGKIDAFLPQDLSTTVWAFAKAGVSSPALFEAVAAEALVGKVKFFNSVDYANTVWAFATAGIEAPLLFEAVAEEAPKKMHKFRSEELTNIAWAFATAKIDAPLLYNRVAAEATKKIDTFAPHTLERLHAAFISAKVDAPRLFEAIRKRIPTEAAAVETAVETEAPRNPFFS